MQKYILLLIIVSLFFTGCFQKDASQEESGLIDIDMSEENEITSSGTVNVVDPSEEKIVDEEKISNNSTDTTISGSGSAEATDEQTQQAIDESLSDLDEILTEDIINEIFGNAQ